MRRRRPGGGPGIALGRFGVSEKKIIFLAKTLSKLRFFIVVPPFLSSCNLTVRSGVRGKAGSNWVRKIFKCFCSLESNNRLDDATAKGEVPVASSQIVRVEKKVSN
jgi:hypothetical protein